MESNPSVTTNNGFCFGRFSANNTNPETIDVFIAPTDHSLSGWQTPKVLDQQLSSLGLPAGTCFTYPGFVSGMFSTKEEAKAQVDARINELAALYQQNPDNRSSIILYDLPSGTVLFKKEHSTCS